MGRVSAVCFGCQVEPPEVFNVVFDVACAGGAVRGVGGVGAIDIARRRLPVHQAQLHGTGINATHHDALGAECAVVQPLGVGVFQGFGNVAHHLQALRDGE